MPAAGGIARAVLIVNRRPQHHRVALGQQGIHLGKARPGEIPASQFAFLRFQVVVRALAHRAGKAVKAALAGGVAGVGFPWAGAAAPAARARKVLPGHPVVGQLGFVRREAMITQQGRQAAGLAAVGQLGVLQHRLHGPQGGSRRAGGQAGGLRGQLWRARLRHAGQRGRLGHPGPCIYVRRAAPRRRLHPKAQVQKQQMRQQNRRRHLQNAPHGQPQRLPAAPRLSRGAGLRRVAAGVLVRPVYAALLKAYYLFAVCHFPGLLHLEASILPACFAMVSPGFRQCFPAVSKMFSLRMTTRERCALCPATFLKHSWLP